MDQDFIRSDPEKRVEQGSLKFYVIAFIASILLTLTAYLLVVRDVFTKEVLVFSIVGLGILQAMIQLVFFLHLGKESKPRWNLLVFLFMVLVVVILVFGSLWIMFSLNDRLMPMSTIYTEN